MKRRQFLGTLAGTGALLASGRLLADFAEGRNFMRLDSPVDYGLEQGRIKVVEAFWYGCPHCYSFEPLVQEWKATLPEDVEFEYMPAPLNDVWALHARVYYAAEQLDIVEAIHQPFYTAIHEQGRQMRSESAILRFVNQMGEDADAFREAMRSDGVARKVGRSAERVREYRLEGVPSMVVNGESVVSASMTTSHEQMLEIVDHLIAEARG